MAANGKQKLKLLYLYKMLDEQTDAEHGLSMTQILEKLEEQGYRQSARASTTT